MQTITAPATVRELDDFLENLNLTLPEGMDLLRDVMGDEWWGSDEEFTICTAPVSVPSPGRATIPPGFTPLDDEFDIFMGKSMTGARWKIESEWHLDTNTFTMTPWTTDDDPMTAAEVREYSAAMLEMVSYISSLETDAKAVGATSATEGD